MSRAAYPAFTTVQTPLAVVRGRGRECTILVRPYVQPLSNHSAHLRLSGTGMEKLSRRVDRKFLSEVNEEFVESAWY